MKKYIMLVLVMGLVIFNGCMNNKKIAEKGDKVKVYYVGKLENGNVFDKSSEGKPLEFVLGSGNMISGFDKAVEGMRLNGQVTVTLKPEDAYGRRDESAKKKFARKTLPPDFIPKKGMVIGLRTGPGQRGLPATIIDVDKDSITVDVNHPLAGKTLIFNIKLVGLEKAK